MSDTIPHKKTRYQRMIERETPEQAERRKKSKRDYYHRTKGSKPVDKQRIKKSRDKSFAVKLGQWKYGAQTRNIEIRLTDQQAIDLFLKPCFYCGQTTTEKLNGIDRKDNERFYDQSNSVPCCSPCNMLKRDFKFEDFMSRLRTIVKNIDYI